MEVLEIKGGQRLNGSLKIGKSKNACLPILAGVVLSQDNVYIEDLPHYVDIEYMLKILSDLGVKIIRDDSGVYFDSSVISGYKVNEECTKMIRASIFMLGPLLSRLRHAIVAESGGCNIGKRPIDIHLYGLRCLGVDIVEENGFIYCDGSNMHSSEFTLSMPSVGATENLMMASVLLSGTTTIHNVAREPEIVDLQNFINSMGGKVSGAGSSTLIITGVERLHSTRYSPISDRIVAGTYLVAGAMTYGNIEITDSNYQYNLALIEKLRQTGCQIDVKDDKIHLVAPSRQSSVDISTSFYPDFPTDLQSVMLGAMCFASGQSTIQENLFENRFQVCNELIKMGADILVNGRVAVVNGQSELYGTTVSASDLRGGASLVLSGLRAKNTTIVQNVFHIDRGYDKIEDNLRHLGAIIYRKDI